MIFSLKEFQKDLKNLSVQYQHMSLDRSDDKMQLFKWILSESGYLLEGKYRIQGFLEYVCQHIVNDDSSSAKH